MPDTAPAHKGLSLGKPGGKEYLLVGGLTLGAALLYFWYEKKKKASAASSGTGSTGSTVYYPSPTGLSASQLLAWLSDHQSSPAPTTPTAPTAPTAPGKDVPGAVRGLQVARITRNSVTLAWQPTPGAELYSVAVPSEGGAMQKARTTAGTSATVSGLKKATAYQFEVTAQPSKSGHSRVSARTAA
jgi:fibronectin type III domain protein